MRHHFDYKEFKDEKGCPERIRNRLEEECGLSEDAWTLGGRWNPIRLPSETQASILRLSVSSECLSVISNSNIVIALVRSKSIYETPLGQWHRLQGWEKSSYPCAIDLYAATVDTASICDLSSDSPDSSRSIVHFYTRLLILRCYEDSYLRHDTQSIRLDESERVGTKYHPHIGAMHRRRLELIKLKQDLSGYLGISIDGQKGATVHKSPEDISTFRMQQFQGLLSDIEMLLSLYDNNMKIYGWQIGEIVSDYREELSSQQLAEAKASKATAISLGKLSNMAFLYLPVNFVCAMLGMNLAVLGQGTVPIWAFCLLTVFFSLITYIPILLPQVDQRKIQLYKIAYHLGKRSFTAGFWFLAFCSTHSYLQSFEITNSGLAQTLLGHTGARTKGWIEGYNDEFFEQATWGSQTFWKEKVKGIYLAVDELNLNNEAALPAIQSGERWPPVNFFAKALHVDRRC